MCRRKSCRKFVARKIVIKKIQNAQYAHHVRHIVIGYHGVCQSENKQRRLFFLNNIFDSEYNQGENGHCVYPHDIPRISDKITAESIHRAEHYAVSVKRAVGLVYVVSKRSRRAHCLQQKHKSYRIGHVFVSENKHQNRKRTAAIVEKVTDKAAAQARTP